MTMGQKIKQYREKLGLSQEELGASLTPQVNKAAINKWEKGTVENIKRTHIQQLAKLFRISPCDLMCWEDSTVSTTQQSKGTASSDELIQTFSELNKEIQACKLVEQCYGSKAYELVKMFIKLNDTGKIKALENMSDFVQLPKYTEHEKREQPKMA